MNSPRYLYGCKSCCFGLLIHDNKLFSLNFEPKELENKRIDPYEPYIRLSCPRCLITLRSLELWCIPSTTVTTISCIYGIMSPKLLALEYFVTIFIMLVIFTVYTKRFLYLYDVSSFEF